MPATPERKSDSMRTVLIGAAAAAGCLLAVLAPESSRVAWSGPVAPTEDVKPVEDSMHEFMEYVFQPTYLRLKATMTTAPADNKGWKAIKADSLVLAESCNLLFSRAPDGAAADWIAHAKPPAKKALPCMPLARQRTLQPPPQHGNPCWKAAMPATNSSKTASTFCSPEVQPSTFP